MPIVPPRNLHKMEVLIGRKMTAADHAVCRRKDLVYNAGGLDAKGAIGQWSCQNK